MNYLFICTANKDRSRTAELHFQAKYPDHRFRSAGINKYLSQRHGGVHVKRYVLDVADVILCAEKVHETYILSKIDACFSSKIKVLNLGDTERFMSKSLIKLLESCFSVEKGLAKSITSEEVRYASLGGILCHWCDGVCVGNGPRLDTELGGTVCNPCYKILTRWQCHNCKESWKRHPSEMGHPQTEAKLCEDCGG